MAGDALDTTAGAAAVQQLLLLGTLPEPVQPLIPPAEPELRGRGSTGSRGPGHTDPRADRAGARQLRLQMLCT